MAGTILLVDSDLIDRADWHALLQFHGYKVYTAANGKAALDCFLSVLPDVVLMDSALPDIPSDEVCRRLKADPRTVDTPIVVVGSNESRGHVWHARTVKPGARSTYPATRTQALHRIHDILAGGQFHLFSDSPEKAHDCPECSRRLSAGDSMEFDG